MPAVLARYALLVVFFSFTIFFFAIFSDAAAQSKEFRPGEISGGAEASLLVPRAKDVFPFAPSPTRTMNPAGFIPGIGFPAYNFDDNIIEAGTMMIPPDPCGAAGPDRLIAVVNVGIECRDKAGNLIFRDSLRDLFSPLGPQTLGTVCFDPKVVFDHHHGRFVVVALERWFTSAGDPSNESRILVAVSNSPTPSTSSATDWYFMAIDSKMNIGGVDHWADYPGFEVDEEVVYISLTMFPFSGPGSFQRLWIIDKGLGGGFYAGGPAAWSVYDPVPPGFYHLTLMPALVFGPGGAGPGVGTYLVGYNSLTNGGPGAAEFVQVIRVDNPVFGATFTGEFVNVGELENVGGVYGFPAIPDAPQSGGPALIEVNDSRALDAVWRNNSLWITTTIRPNSANDPVNVNQATAHWFRLDTSAVPAPITLADQGNIGGEDIAPGTFTFFPAVAVNANNDAKFGFAASASSIFGGAYFAGRESTDPPGTVQPAFPVQVGLDYYLRTFGSPRNRWGDYSGAAVDPIDDLSFWIFNEYAEVRGTPTPTPPEDGRWGTAWKSCMVDGVPPPLDFGDIPDLPYPTFLASNGARHQIVPGVYLGASIDSEPDGQTSPPNAIGDDTNGADDEDGVLFQDIFIAGHTAAVTVTASQDGWLDIWFDWNNNGSLVNPGEHVYSGAVTAGSNVLAFTVPMTAPLGGFVFGRFRYNLSGPLGVAGLAPDGEVEDYMITTRPVDYGDAPAPYRTLLANAGARHVLTGATMYMGNTIDFEYDGQPHANAQGDDLGGGPGDDEDGVVFTTALDPTHPASVNITVTHAGFVNAWIDFNDDGIWDSGAERILYQIPVSPGVNSLGFSVPGTGGSAFTTFARFRYSTSSVLPPDGLAQNGEVEDYEVQILEDTVTPVDNNDTPERFALFDPMPNPFNPSTTLSFALPAASPVLLEVYDVRGQLVATLLDEKRTAGVHRVTWDGRDRSGQSVASGVYLCRIKAGTFTDTKRMVLIK